jgi:hypothetical protein
VDEQRQPDPIMRGVEYVVGDDGKRRAVVIDLREHGALWEDFYDTWLAHERADEPRETLRSVKAKLGLDDR